MHNTTRSPPPDSNPSSPTRDLSSLNSTPPLRPQSTTSLHLPELLELILLHLSQKDLLLSQRASRSFRHTILHSPTLQRALFLLPDWRLENRVPLTTNSKSGGKCSANNRNRKPENNRLLLRAFPGCYPTVTLYISNDADLHWPLLTSSTTIDTSSTPQPSHPQEHWSWDVCISFPADHPPNTSPAVLYPEASWRKMFLSQPPCTSLHLVRRWQRSLSPAIVDKMGIRMGEFVSVATRGGVKEEVGTEIDGARLGEACIIRESDDVGRTSEGARGQWHSSYIGSDRDWHFEGNIRFEGSKVEDDLEKTRAEEFTARLRGYLFSRPEVRV